MRPAAENEGSRANRGSRKRRPRPAVVDVETAPNHTTPTRTCSWVRVPRRSNRTEPASSSTRRPPSTPTTTAEAGMATGTLTGERQSELDPELYLWRQMLSFLHPLEGDRPENATFAAINADIFDTAQLNFREMSAERRQRSIMAFLRLVALLFAEVSRAMVTGATPDGHALLQLATPAASARVASRPTSATTGPTSSTALPFNVWRRPPPNNRAHPEPARRDDPGLFKARRHDSGKLLDDPASWHVFRRWAKGDLSDEDVIEEHGSDYLTTLRAELELLHKVSRCTTLRAMRWCDPQTSMR